ncbi:MAG: beta-lactamase family protein [Lachnospiraceae bacterium]|nr:beta-lactamase family protein [Lachnospiraceae bacterium]
MKTLRKHFIILLILACLLMPGLSGQAAGGGQTTPSGIPFSELESQIDAVVAKHLGITTPGVAVAVVYEGEIIFSKGYGYADIENNIPIDPAVTVFGYASVGKLFAWVSAMQLAERGLLDLDADISRYLTVGTARQLEFTYAITMRDLMNHMAGFEPAAFDVSYDTLGTESLGSLGDVLVLSKPQQAMEPGTVSAYSNYGAALAAYVAAAAAGQEYAEYEHGNIFMPAGMDNTLSLPGWLENDAFLEARANSYAPDGQGGFARNADNIALAIWPAGMTSGTAYDLARFAIALTPPQGSGGPLFGTADGLARIFTPSSLNPERPGTHHGFWRYEGISPAFGHAGHSYHFTNFAVMPEERFGFLSLSNGLEDVNVAISSLLLGAGAGASSAQAGPRAEAEAKPGAGDFPDATEVAGNYQLAQMRFTGSFLSLITHLSPPDTVTAIDKNKIEINSAMFGTAVYHQIEPYLYRVAGADNPAMGLYFNTLLFRMADGKPVQIHAGDGKDLVYVPSDSGFAMLFISFAVSAAFFMIFPAVLFAGFLINRKKGAMRTRFMKFGNLLFFSGTLLTLNNVVLFFRAVSMPVLKYAPLTPHIWLNYLFAGSSVLLFLISLGLLHREKPAKRRLVFYFVTAVLTAVLLFALISWKFFVFI